MDLKKRLTNSIKGLVLLFRLVFCAIRRYREVYFLMQELFFWEKQIKRERFDEFTHHLAKPTLVNRDAFLLQACTGKNVLHVGFLDAPYTREKLEQGTLLHTKIRNVASTVMGLDLDQELAKAYADISGDSNFKLQNLENNQGCEFVKDYDVILLGEVVEHMSNPVQCLQTLVENASDTTLFVFTVPNALTPDLLLPALFGIESVHEDHVFWFSPVTFKELLNRAGLQVEQECVHNWRKYANSPTDKSGYVASGLVFSARKKSAS